MSTVQKQAYLNEYKGNLFEFLVAKNLAENYKLLPSFLEHIPQELFTLLGKYEQELRSYDEELVTSLIESSLKVSQSICSFFQFKKVEDIFLTGKFVKQFEGKLIEEADFLIQSEKGAIPISLKFCKKNCFINTKSAGVRTFFSHYFDAKKIQDEVNKKIDVYFESFARKIHEQNDIFDSYDFKVWRARGLPELPGDLKKEDNETLKELYSEIASLFYLKFKELGEVDLSSLSGKGRADIVTVVCFHEGTKDHRFYKSFIDKTGQKESWKLLPYQKGLASFELESQGKKLQVRIKPMNKFTVPSFKVNCSVKYRSI